MLDTIVCADALEFLRSLPDASVDAVITDPPYAEVDREYGRMPESQWADLLHAVTLESRRILKPQGSAVFVLQPNSECVGSMRAWVWRYMVWVSEQWNIVQDAYWWNFTAMPSVHATQYGLMRPSIKTLVWCGAPDCYRNQDAVLWTPSQAMLAENKGDMALRYYPSGYSLRKGRFAETVNRRGGTTPFNLLPIANADSADSAGSHGHGAGTPEALISWWIKYISKPHDVVCDPFMGSGTTALTARQLGRSFIGCDSSPEYVAIANERLQNTDPYQDRKIAPNVTQHSLFAEAR